MKNILVFCGTLLATTAAAQTRSAAVEFLNPSTVMAPKGYSQAAKIDFGTATMLLVSGQVALDGQGRTVGPGDVGQQAEQAFANLEHIVEAAGGNMQQVVKLSIYLLDIGQLPAVRTVRDRYINPAMPPTSTAMQVSKLFRDDLLLEIEATVIIPKKGK